MTCEWMCKICKKPMAARGVISDPLSGLLLLSAECVNCGKLEWRTSAHKSEKSIESKEPRVKK